MNPVPIHPAAELVPPMTDEEYQGLKADIAANGLLQPIILFGGQILDGKFRYRACRELGITPRLIEWRRSGSPLAIAQSLNDRRRHLSDGQRAAYAVAVADALAAEAKVAGRANLRQAKGPKPEPVGKSRERAAELLGVSARYVQDAKLIRRLSPPLFAQVMSGAITLPQAKRAALRGVGVMPVHQGDGVRVIALDLRTGMSRSIVIQGTTPNAVLDHLTRSLLAH